MEAARARCITASQARPTASCGSSETSGRSSRVLRDLDSACSVGVMDGGRARQSGHSGSPRDDHKPRLTAACCRAAGRSRATGQVPRMSRALPASSSWPDPQCLRGACRTRLKTGPCSRSSSTYRATGPNSGNSRLALSRGVRPRIRRSPRRPGPDSVVDRVHRLAPYLRARRLHTLPRRS